MLNYSDKADSWIILSAAETQRALFWLVPFWRAPFAPYAVGAILVVPFFVAGFLVTLLRFFSDWKESENRLVVSLSSSSFVLFILLMKYELRHTVTHTITSSTIQARFTQFLLRESVAIGHLCVLMLEHKTLTYHYEILGGGTSCVGKSGTP